MRGSIRRIFPSAPSSNATSTCDAMNMDEYVPTITPSSRTIRKSRRLCPPNSNIASITVLVVTLVPSDRMMDSRMDAFTVSRNDRDGTSSTFSLTRSNITMVSFTEYPITVSIPTMNMAFTSVPMVAPSAANMPSTMMTSWASAATAPSAYRYDPGTVRKAYMM